MTADYAALEARVAELEQQLRHMLPAKGERDLPANHAAYLLAAEHGQMLAQHADMRDQLADHGRALAEILRRLPDNPA